MAGRNHADPDSQFQTEPITTSSGRKRFWHAGWQITDFGQKALAHYTLQRYQAAITLAEAEDALKHPLVLQRSDIEKLSAYRFDQAS